MVPAEAADTERPPLAAGTACREGRAGPAWLQLPLTALLLVLASLALLLEVTQLLRGHTQVTTGQVSRLAETLGLLAGCLEPGGWAPELRRWAGHPCGGTDGRRQAGGS